MLPHIMKLRNPSLTMMLAIVLFSPSVNGQEPVSFNSGSLGASGNGIHTWEPLLDQPGALAAPGDFSVEYQSGSRTMIPFQSAINPPADQPFTIEFWARPFASDGDDAPVVNRFSDGDRTGWAFFQRSPETGWNFRMYEGNGSSYGWNITGGTSELDAWSHVVAVWTGSAARLYVNGVLAADTNEEGSSGVYVENTFAEAILSIGAYSDSGTAIDGRVDEIAFYSTMLSAEQIQAHFTAAASPMPGAYSSLVIADGALVYLQQNPPTIQLTSGSPAPTLDFTGILEVSEDLETWQDLAVESPYTPVPPASGNQFFRVRR